MRQKIYTRSFILPFQGHFFEISFDLGNQFPFEFCAKHPSIASSEGCKGYIYPAEVCAKNFKLAISPSCADAAKDMTFLQCVGDGRICRAKICDLKVKNKEFCPK